MSAVSKESIATDNKVSGQVEAEDTATVMVGVSAKCTRTYVEAGDLVRAGDLLCTLDLDSTLSQYNAAKINYAAAVQNFNDQRTLLDQQINVAQEQVTVSERQIAVTRESIAAAEQQLAASEQQIPVLEQQISVLEQQVPMTEQQISVTEQQVGVAQQQADMGAQQISVAEQNAALAEQNAAQAEKNLQDTREMLAIGAASQNQVDQLQLAANQARMAADQAKMNVDAAKTGVAQSQMGVDQAKMAADNARLGREQSDLQINQLKAQLTQTRASLESSRAQIDQSRFSLSQLELSRDNAQVQVRQLQSSRNSTLAQLEAGVENSRASVQQMETMLEDVDEHGNVVAPMSGTLVTFNAVENSYLSNAMPVAVIDGEGRMKLTVSVSEALVPKLSIGDQADVYVAALDRSVPAYIRSVERAANAQNRLYTVTLALPEDTTGLLSGMFADVTFHTDRVEDAVVVPSEAILTSGETEYVFTVENGQARYVEIVTGLTGTGVTEVLSGLRGGETLVTKGQSYLRDGDAVRIVTGE